MKTLSALILAFCFLMLPLQAQTGITSYVFPQIPNGVSGGLVYFSDFYITNLNKVGVSCKISLYGFTKTPFLYPVGSTFNVYGGEWETAYTSGEGVLGAGYARLDCSGPVNATLIYSLSKQVPLPPGTISPGNVTGMIWEPVGMATVPPSPLTTYAYLPMATGSGSNSRYGIAISNDNDTAATIGLTLTEAGQFAEKQKQISVPKRSHSVGFADEYFSIPWAGYWTLEIESLSGHQFSVVGLLYQGAVFTTLAPAIR